MMSTSHSTTSELIKNKEKKEKAALYSSFNTSGFHWSTGDSEEKKTKRSNPE